MDLLSRHILFHPFLIYYDGEITSCPDRPARPGRKSTCSTLSVLRFFALPSAGSCLFRQPKDDHSSHNSVRRWAPPSDDSRGTYPGKYRQALPPTVLFFPSITRVALMIRLKQGFVMLPPAVHLLQGGLLAGVRSCRHSKQFFMMPVPWQTRR